MREHKPLTDKFWQGISDNEQVNPISLADYEEWRSNPVTNRLYTHLERQVASKQAQCVDSVHWTDEVISDLVRTNSGYVSCVTEIFEWSPDGIELEEVE